MVDQPPDLQTVDAAVAPLNSTGRPLAEQVPDTTMAPPVVALT